MKADLLDISEAQAQVLRAIAYYEYESKEKGATKYNCYENMPKKLRPHSTFKDSIEYLEKNLFVIRLKEKKTGKRIAKPFTITAIGQIAWLRHFPNSDNIEIIQQLFPNIQLSAVDIIFDQIDNKHMKYTNKFSTGVLKIALDSFHLEESNVLQGYKGKLVKERIELSADDGYLETSFTRWYSVVDPVLFKKLSKDMTYYTKNFDELEISIIDRITFLFYYNLIQLVTDISFQMIFSKITPLDIVLDKIRMDERITELQNLSVKIDPEIKRNVKELQREVVKKSKEILKIIASNTIVCKIMQDNLKDISKQKNHSFQNMSKMFIKN